MPKNNKIRYLGLTFDDVLLVPNYSTIMPKEADTSCYLTKSIKLNLPVVSSAMDTVTESEMAIAIARQGGLGFLHKNLLVEQQVAMIGEVKKTSVKGFLNSATDKKGRLLVGAAVGVRSDAIDNVEVLIKAGADIIIIDSAHGHSQKVLDTIKLIKQKFKNLPVVSGNLVTKEAALASIKHGADVIKVGVGPGSICTTRIVTGVGFPQLSAIMQVAEVCKKNNIPLIADGGVRYTGDIPKAIAAGATCVMLGGMLAGTKEAPGKLLEIGGKQYKSYRGMGSLGAMAKGTRDRYFQDVEADIKKLVTEGVEGKVEYKGNLSDVVYQIAGGLRAAMGYCGCKTIKDLQENTYFVQMTGAGQKESHPHSIHLVKTAPNY